ncbi:hypothetical protein Ddye_003385, partial [Dipteronia dyeriana]
ECWVENTGCADIAQEAWATLVMYNGMLGLVSKLRSCIDKLRRWNVINKRGLRHAIDKKHIELLLDSEAVHIGSWKHVHSIERELDSLLHQDEVYWHQRSCETWLKRGDRNSKYFHWRTSNRRVRNMRKGLYDSSGNWKENKIDISHVVIQDFANLFCSSHLSSIDRADSGPGLKGR